ncbi:Magnesium-dependent phosphatase 1 [Homalodisca vitripennis]|nr:Magnesium-dependent phosphatase 1 [Homalodisca vitripennis]KAG8313637.1 Magnesium-dependent phosphatase 1 [Homalodisca vitripennis]KAG8334057.1 Magnesium-dependent phosphatase 1 [Homalodisca vitripennis]
MFRTYMLYILLVCVYGSAMSGQRGGSQSAPRKCDDFLPKLMIFEVDRVFWPFQVETDVVPPFGLRRYQPISNENSTKLWSGDFEGRELFDSKGRVLQVYSYASEAISTAWKKGTKIAVTATTTKIPTVKHLLRLFDLDEHITVMEIDDSSSLDHVKKIKGATGLQFKDIVYLGSNRVMLNEIKRTLKVLTVYISPKSGLNVMHIYYAIYFYNLRPYIAQYKSHRQRQRMPGTLNTVKARPS